MSKLQCTLQQAHAAARKKIEAGRRSGEWQYEVWLDGKFQFKVSIPDEHGRGSDLIAPGTLKGIMSQLKLTREEFIRWRDCPMDKTEYERIIRDRLKIRADS